jgi:hypothetical protein
VTGVRNIFWWLCFALAAVWAQSRLPGLDALAAGIIILFQERDYRNMLWLLPVFILIQEGMGTRFFGGAIIWYTAVVLFFLIGHWLFEVDTFLFVLILSASLVAPYMAIEALMAPLQQLPFQPMQSLDKSVMQAVFLPFAWQLLVWSRRLLKPRYSMTP